VYHWKRGGGGRRVCTGNLDMHLDFDVATEIKNNCNLDTCVGPVG
jgi:hypothetical protein